MRGYKGWFYPKNVHKCMNKEGKVYFRSKLEFKILKKLDESDNFVKWGYELVKIKYKDPLKKNKERDYVMDVIVKFRTGEVELWEIKPLSIANAKYDGRKSALLNEEIIRNQAKWKAAKEYADKRGLGFRIIGH